jgi:Flp pilus assembly protein TadD
MIALLIFILLASCTSPRVDRPERIAVLPFENLTPDSKLDWLGTAAAAALVADLAGVPKVYAFRADSVRGLYAGRASQVLEGSFEVVGRDQLQLHASLENIQRRRMTRQFTVGGALREGIIPLVNQLAKQADSAARSFSTRDPAAFSSYGQALSSPDPGAQVRLLQTASVQDPGFSASYIDLSQGLLASGARADADAKAAAGAQNSKDPIDRTKLLVVSALARGDLQARELALTKLSQLTPADPEVFRSLSQVHLLRRKYADAVRDLQAAARVDATDPATFNSLGYAQAYAGDLSGSRQSLGEYRKLAPEGDVNPLDSLGEVSFYLGDFKAAERDFLEAHQRNPELRGGFELVKAAQARLMTGDRQSADAIFNRYLDFRKTVNPVLNDYQHGQWEWLSGRRKQALNRIQHSLPSATGDIAAFLNSQLCVWNLQIGNRVEAARFAENGAAQAVSPAAQTVAGLCRFLSAQSPQHSGNDLVDGYALLFLGRFAEAVPLLEKVYWETPPEADAQIRTLLAWAYSKTGRTRDAATLTVVYPIPLSGGEDILTCLIFPRFLQIRSAVLELQGKHDEAQRLARLYRDYSGDLPDKL